MRLEFRVLWFENQPQDVRTQIQEIEDYVKESGFTPKIQMEVDASNLDAFITQQQLYDDFDLVVVDFDLGSPQDENGDHVAQAIRRGFGFTDIVFYSGQRTVDLRKVVHERQIDGVYCLERPRLAERLGVHIDQAVKRMSRLEAMRGLAMGTVGKCDDELRVFLLARHGKATEGQQDAFTTALDALVVNGATVQRERYEKCDTFEERLNSRAVTSFHLQKLALQVLKGDQQASDIRKKLGYYNEQVLKPRNTLGHAIESRGAAGWEVSSGGETPITAADFPILRQNMAVHVENIFRLRQQVGLGAEAAAIGSAQMEAALE